MYEFWSQNVQQKCCYCRVVLLDVGGLQIGPNLLKLGKNEGWDFILRNMWTDLVVFFQTLRRRVEAFAAPPLLQKTLLAPKSSSRQFSGSCGINHQSAEWVSASPHKPLAPTPRIGSLSCLHFHLNLLSFGEKYLIDPAHIWGASATNWKASCSPMSHMASSWLQYLAESRQVPCIAEAGQGGICAMCAFQKYGWKVMMVEELFICYGLGDWRDSRLARKKKKPTRERKCKTDLGGGGEGGGFLMNL